MVTAINWIGALFFGVLSFRYAWTLVKPGTLSISPDGISQSLGWRTLRGRWDDIEQVELRKTAANMMTVCMIHPAVGGPVRLFG